MADDIESVDPELIHEAEDVATNVRALRRLMLRSFEPDIAQSGLTAPQINTLTELSREDGLSLKELSGRMGLSHSTVSGIVDRLERKGLVGRTPNPEDRRYSRISLSEVVKEYIRDEVPFLRRDPILKVFMLASAEERAQILTGTRTLRRLLEAVVSGESKDQSAGMGTR